MKVNRDKFYESYRQRFGPIREQVQVDGLNELLFLVEHTGDQFGISLPQWAYIFATIKHECADTWHPITEYGDMDYFNKYEPNTSLGKALGNTVEGDGYKFRGRGYVQITGRGNYKRMSQKIGIDFVDYPDRAKIPQFAFDIICIGMRDGLFTGKKLSDYINDKEIKYFYARQIVNGMDKSKLIGEYALDFERIFDSSIVSDADTVKLIKPEKNYKTDLEKGDSTDSNGYKRAESGVESSKSSDTDKNHPANADGLPDYVPSNFGPDPIPMISFRLSLVLDLIRQSHIWAEFTLEEIFDLAEKIIEEGERRKYYDK